MAVESTFESGAVAYHGATWGARGTRQGYDFQIQTEKGLLEYSSKLAGQRILLYDKIGEHKPGTDESSDYRIIWEAPEIKGNGNTKFTHFEIDHFADCVINGKEPITNGETALKSLELIWSLYDGEEHDTAYDLTKYAYSDEDMKNYAEYIKKSL